MEPLVLVHALLLLILLSALALHIPYAAIRPTWKTVLFFGGVALVLHRAARRVVPSLFHARHLYGLCGHALLYCVRVDEDGMATVHFAVVALLLHVLLTRNIEAHSWVLMILVPGWTTHALFHRPVITFPICLAAAACLLYMFSWLHVSRQRLRDAACVYALVAAVLNAENPISYLPVRDPVLWKLGILFLICLPSSLLARRAELLYTAATSFLLFQLHVHDLFVRLASFAVAAGIWLLFHLKQRPAVTSSVE